MVYFSVEYASYIRHTGFPPIGFPPIDWGKPCMFEKPSLPRQVRPPTLASQRIEIRLLVTLIATVRAPRLVSLLPLIPRTELVLGLGFNMQNLLVFMKIKDSRFLTLICEQAVVPGGGRVRRDDCAL